MQGPPGAALLTCRNLAADFRLALGEASGALQVMAPMTDGDNTESQLDPWYFEITLR